MIRRSLERVVDFKDGEFAPAVLAAALYFCIMFGYFLLRPLRDAMGLDGGVDSLRVLFLVGLGVMVLANVAFGYLTSKFPRRVFLPFVYVFAAACLGIFLAIFHFTSGNPPPIVGKVFFVWLSTFNLFAVSVLWGYVADLFSLERSKRLFGFIGVGGTAGAIVGSAYTGVLVQRLGETGLFASAIILVLIAAFLVVVLDRIARQRGFSAHQEEDPGAIRPLGGASLKGIADVIRSPYLRMIAMYMLVFTIDRKSVV